MDKLKRVEDRIESLISESEEAFSYCLELGESCSQSRYSDAEEKLNIISVLSQMFESYPDWFRLGEIQYKDFDREFLSFYEAPSGCSLDYPQTISNMAYNWFVLISR